MENSTTKGFVSGISSLPGESKDDSEVRSMAAKGINHLCSELLELKAESSEDFHRAIISSCLSFSRIFEEVKAMQKDLMLLKSHISAQTSIVKDLIDGIDLKVESEQLKEPSADFSLGVLQFTETSSWIDLETRIYEVSKSLENLILENRTEQALDIIKVADENILSLKVEGNCPFDLILLYDCVISDKKDRIKHLLTRASAIANTETPAPDPSEETTEL